MESSCHKILAIPEEIGYDKIRYIVRKYALANPIEKGIRI